MFWEITMESKPLVKATQGDGDTRYNIREIERDEVERDDMVAVTGSTGKYGM